MLTDEPVVRALRAEVRVVEGAGATLGCAVTGYPPPRVWWTRAREGRGDVSRVMCNVYDVSRVICHLLELSPGEKYTVDNAQSAQGLDNNMQSVLEIKQVMMMDDVKDDQ